MGSSSSASGLPCASATNRWRTGGANAGNRCVEQGRRRRIVERLEFVAGQSSAIEEALGFGPHRRQETDTGAGEPTHGRSKHQRACSVQPRQVVDDHEQRASGGGVAKKSENRVRQHQSVRRHSGIQTQSDAQRLAIQRRQHGKAVEERMQNMVEPREAQLRFELCADSPKDPGPSRLCMECDDIEQRGLADTSVAGHQQRPTADSRLIDEPADELDVRVPADQLSGKPTGHGRPPFIPAPLPGAPTRVGRSGPRHFLSRHAQSDDESPDGTHARTFTAPSTGTHQERSDSARELLAGGHVDGRLATARSRSWIQRWRQRRIGGSVAPVIVAG